MESQTSFSQTKERLINTALLKEYLVEKFKTVIGNFPADRILLLDPSLELKFTYLFPKKEDIRSLALELCLADSDTFSCEEKNVIFLTTPTVFMAQRIAKIINTNKMNKANKTYYVIFTPRRTVMCKEALEREGVYKEVNTINFNFDLIPIENDLLSMQLDEVPRELYLDADTSSLVFVAEAIQRMQAIYGYIPHVIGKGTAARATIEILLNLENDALSRNEGEEDITSGKIGAVLLLDRCVDFITPLMTQFTYSGILDEMFGIKNNMVTVNSKILRKEETENDEEEKEIRKMTLVLDNDFVYSEIKDLHNIGAWEYLEKQWKRVQELKSQAKTNDKDISNFNKALTITSQIQKEAPLIIDHRALQYYFTETMSKPSHFLSTKAEQGIMDKGKSAETLEYLDYIISKQVKLEKVLRLLCLQSQVENGLRVSALEWIKREILQVYGFEQIILLSNLEKAGLLKKDTGRNIWSEVNRELKLVNVEVKLNPPNDAAYAYDGYCSILVRLLEKLFQKDGWKNIQEALHMLQGSIIYDERTGLDIYNMGKKRAIVAFFIGGVTYSEIGAVRYLAKAYSNN